MPPRRQNPPRRRTPYSARSCFQRNRSGSRCHREKNGGDVPDTQSDPAPTAAKACPRPRGSGSRSSTSSVPALIRATSARSSLVTQRYLPASSPASPPPAAMSTRRHEVVRAEIEARKGLVILVRYEDIRADHLHLSRIPAHRDHVDNVVRRRVDLDERVGGRRGVSGIARRDKGSNCDDRGDSDEGGGQQLTSATSRRGSWRFRADGLERRVLIEDRLLDLAQRGTRLESELVAEDIAAIAVDSSASAWRPLRYSAVISCPRSRSRNGCAATRSRRSATSSSAMPSATSASNRSSRAPRRSSSRPRAISRSANARTRTRQAARPAKYQSLVQTLGRAAWIISEELTTVQREAREAASIDAVDVDA